jgi:threonine synthase
LAATKALIKRGDIKRGVSVVVCGTGNGFKTADVMFDRGAKPTQIGRSLADFERVLGAQIGVAVPATARAREGLSAIDLCALGG